MKRTLVLVVALVTVLGMAAVGSAQEAVRPDRALPDKVADLKLDNPASASGVAVSDKIDEIQTILRRKASFSFNRILRRSRSRAEVVITFLALLELFRSGLVRVEQAKRLLETTLSPVDEVSAAVGYEDAAFFRALFKRHTGMSPAEYRENFGATAAAERGHSRQGAPRPAARS
mgnify:CR=1 FL=1